MFLKACLTNAAAAPPEILMQYDLYTHSLKNVFAIFL